MTMNKSSALFKLGLTVFLLVYFLYLVLSRIPAIYMASAIHSEIPTFWLSGLEGTLWRGTASSAQIDIKQQPIALGEVSWRVQPLSLLMLSPCIEFNTTLPRQIISGIACRSLSGVIDLEQVDISAPAPVVNEILVLELAGDISLQISDAQLLDGDIQALSGQMSWQGARTKVNDKWIDLGSIAAKLSADEQGMIQAEIFELSGPYKLKLQAKWALGGEPSVAGTVMPQAGASDMVVQGLQVLGEPLDDGNYKVQWPL